MFACGGALADAKTGSLICDSDDPRPKICELVHESKWDAIQPQTEFRSQILMIRKAKFRKKGIGELRRLFIRNQIAVSDLGDGFCRISIPKTLDKQEYRQLRLALASI